MSTWSKENRKLGVRLLTSVFTISWPCNSGIGLLMSRNAEAWLYPSTNGLLLNRPSLKQTQYPEFIKAVLLMSVLKENWVFQSHISWKMIPKLPYNEGGGLEVL